MDDKAIDTCRVGIYISHMGNRYRTTVIAGGHALCGNRRNLGRTSHGQVLWTSNSRRCAVINENGLDTTAGVAAIICCGPGPGDRPLLWTSSGNCHIGECDGWTLITYICGRSASSGISRDGHHCTLYCDIGRTSNHWRRGILNTDGLSTGGFVATFIQCGPGSCDRIFRTTASRNGYIITEDLGE